MNLRVLRRYHAQIEESLRAELALIQRETTEAEEVRRRVVALVDHDVQRYLDDMANGLSPDETVARYARFEELALQIEREDEFIARAQERAEQKRAEVLAAARETKRMDLLWQRQQRRQRQLDLRREQQAMDEAAARRYVAELQARQKA